MSKKNFERIKPALLDIPKEQVMLPRIPIDTFLQEAHDLYVWAKDDEKELSRVGLDRKILMELPTQIGALQYIQAVWNSERNSRYELTREWEKLLREGRDLRKELIHTFRFSFRQDKTLLKKLRSYGKGRRHAELIQELSDLAVLGNANLSTLKKVGFDKEKLIAASSLCSQMATALAKKNAYDGDLEIKSFRDRAYTRLYLTIQDLRTAGRFAFRGKPKKLIGYRHRYLARKEPQKV